MGICPVPSSRWITVIAIDELEWPSLIRQPMREDEATRFDTPEAQLAYLLAAWVWEWEFSDGRGDSTLANAAEAFLVELERHAGLEIAA